jgi:gag-polypeptide of LTR copia-type
MWDMLVLEFESRSALAQVDLHVKLQNIHCHEKGDIQVHLDKIRQTYINLENIGVTISGDEYTAIIIKSLPPSYADYLSYITGTALALKMKVSSSQLCSQLEQEYIRRKSMTPTNAQPKAKDAVYQADAGPSCHGKKNPRGGKQSNATSAGRTESKRELRC